MKISRLTKAMYRFWVKHKNRSYLLHVYPDGMFLETEHYSTGYPILSTHGLNNVVSHALVGRE